MADSVEPVDEFRARARRWLRKNLAPHGTDAQHRDQSRAARLQRQRDLQGVLFDGGFAGLTFPLAYGGQGLMRAHLQAFSEETAGYDVPSLLAVPSIGVLGATLLDCGTEEQKRRHIPEILRGTEIWVQLLSEPSGGSDMAGVRTRADRDGDEFIVNGSKIWTTNGIYADFGLCLARTDASLPKHRGLTMLIVPLRAAGVEIREIRVAGGQSDFCEEFFDDVRVPAENVVGGFNHGWATASALLIHERDTVGGNSQYANIDDEMAGDGTSMAELATLAFAARARGETGTFERVADAWVRDYAHLCLVDRIVALVADGSLPAEAGALLKLSAAMRGAHRDDIALQLSGTDAVLGEPTAAEPYEFGRRFLMRQAMCLAGGSNEMQQNLISERLLGLPREHRPDIGLSFSEIPSGRDRHR